MNSPMDYNQHLLAYMQAWRQLLETSAAMTSGWPFPPGTSGMPPVPPMPPMPPGMPPGPPMPPMPPMPPGSGGGTANPPPDYAQQLFSYLGTWRRYLEQAIGAAPGTSMPPTTGHPAGGQSTPTYPTDSQPTSSQPTGSPTDSGSSGSQSHDSSSGSQSSLANKNENRIVLRPRDPYGTISDLTALGGLQDMLSRRDFTGPTGPVRRSGSGGPRSPS